MRPLLLRNGSQRRTVSSPENHSTPVPSGFQMDTVCHSYERARFSLCYKIRRAGLGGDGEHSACSRIRHCRGTTRTLLSGREASDLAALGSRFEGLFDGSVHLHVGTQLPPFVDQLRIN